MAARKIVAFVMAGGEGRRLLPLTAACPKPALPFGGFRLIDFALSNLYNSQVRSIYVLAQFCPQPLLDHIARSWTLPRSAMPDFVRPLLPGKEGGQSGYRGTADAVRQNLRVLDRLRPDVVAVFAADHIYRMDVRAMIAFHESCNADATVAAVPVPVQSAREFGVITCEHDGRIRRFDEKPLAPVSMPSDPRHAFVSMGNYLFAPDVLREALGEAARRGEHDFGYHVLPRLLDAGRVYAYDFGMNRVPGVRAHEERGYWRDVGTLDAYAAAHRDVSGPEPRFELHNAEWPICPLGLASTRTERAAAASRERARAPVLESAARL